MLLLCSYLHLLHYNLFQITQKENNIWTFCTNESENQYDNKIANMIKNLYLTKAEYQSCCFWLTFNLTKKQNEDF